MEVHRFSGQGGTDASIKPRIINANTNAATKMCGEKGALAGLQGTREDKTCLLIM
jgi:hypothetical protein